MSSDVSRIERSARHLRLLDIFVTSERIQKGKLVFNLPTTCIRAEGYERRYKSYWIDILIAISVVVLVGMEFIAFNRLLRNGDVIFAAVCPFARQ